MAGQWYCNVGGQVTGPYPTPQLQQMLAHGQINAQTPMSQTPQGPWVPASSVAGLFAAAPAAPATPAAQPAPAARPAPVAQAAPVARAAPAQAAPPAARPAPAAAPMTAAAPLTPQAAAPAPQAHPAAATPVAAASVPRAVPAVPPAAPAAQPAIPRAVPAAPQARPAAPAARPAAPPHSPPTASPAMAAAGQTGSTDVLGERSSRRSGVKGGQYALIAISAVGLILVAGLVIGLATLGSDGGDEDVGQPDDSLAAIDDVPLPGEFADDLDDGSSGPSTTPEQVIASIANWREIKKIVTLPSTVRIQVLDVWVSSSVTGTTRDTVLQSTVPEGESGPGSNGSKRYIFVSAPVPATDDEAAEAVEPPPAKAAPAPPGPRYIFVKMSITSNKPSAPLSYASWNGYGENPAETSAILADSSGNMLQIVPYARNSDASRQRFVNITPAQQITDLLVFRAPQGPIDYVRLALPYAAFGVTNARSSHVGYQITREDLNAPPRDKLVRQPIPRPADSGDPGMDAIRRGIEESTGGDGRPDEGGDPTVTTHDDPPSEEPADGDDSSPFPATGSVGGGDSPSSGFSDEEIPADIRDLIREESDAPAGNDEVKPFDDERIE